MGAIRLMYTFHYPDQTPTLDDVIKLLKIEATQISSDFGVVEIDPVEHLYCVLVDEDIFSTKDEQEKDTLYSNPKIEHFGMEEE